MVVVVATKGELEDQEGDIAGLMIEMIETQTLIAHFPPGFVKIAA